MLSNDASQEELDAGHYRTAGYAVLSMGGIGAVWFVLTILGMVGAGFIDATGIAMISIIFVAVGGMMLATARSGESRG